MSTNRPLTKLEDVRREFNIVAAVSDLDEAKALARALEDAGIQNESIALLGAYPARPTDEVDNQEKVESITGNASEPDIRDGNLAVGVHSDNKEVVTTAGRVMDRHQILSVNRFTGS